ncbi:MAG: imidazole glycerol phosphate synthase subunit HisH [Bacteroidia bacterium]|nr:imidazole glycerol phosphate synthase subunit HisH [Bacteroidia bacterium]GIV23632.1 MAG: imidazole glycerol phosphate synthase subunit HisH [Bacteroidia bacterium]
MKIGLIRYSGGNVRSLRSAIESLGAQVLYSDNPQELSACDGLIFPGVGFAGEAVRDLQAAGLWAWLPTWDRPFLGICLGMQLLGGYCAEGEVPGLGIFAYEVLPFAKSPRRIHIGWNIVAWRANHPLARGLPERFYAYFVHGYRASVGAETLAESVYGEPFSAVVGKDNFFGVQFHPEKSSKHGLILLKNFLDLCR